MPLGLFPDPWKTAASVLMRTVDVQKGAGERRGQGRPHGGRRPCVGGGGLLLLQQNVERRTAGRRVWGQRLGQCGSSVQVTGRLADWSGKCVFRK